MRSLDVQDFLGLGFSRPDHEESQLFQTPIIEDQLPPMEFGEDIQSHDIFKDALQNQTGEEIIAQPIEQEQGASEDQRQVLKSEKTFT
jgi:hypothetical protein